MSNLYPNQPPYPGVSFQPLQPPAQAPERPARPWPLDDVNRWMTIGAAAITLLAVLLAALATRAVTSPPSTAGLTLAYQSSLTQNDTTGQMHWAEGDDCQFTSTGYVTTAPDANHAIRCPLGGSSFQDFTLRVHVIYADGDAIIGFLSGDRLAISGTGRFALYRIDPQTNQISYLYPLTGVGAGSAALHPTSLGVSERGNDITLQVQEMTYSIYANGQLLATYISPTLEDPEAVSLGASGGQAEFSDIAIYTAG
ncbi:MAG TPA: hypothetical protein VFU69_00590 [Ktedonobacterales bacterium]|nr:hypothetical protein [Ktedonobacterales bacterium]